MQVANDVASAKELPRREARPGRRVNNSAAGKLQGGERVSALPPWDAVMLASRLASCAATKASVADWSALLERPVVSELCSAAMLLPCAATWPSVVARAAAVVRGAIAGASALLSSLEASSAVTLSSRDWMAAAMLPDAAVFTARSVTCA